MSLVLRPTIDVTGSDRGRVLARPVNLRARVRAVVAASAVLAQFLFSSVGVAADHTESNLENDAEWMNSVRTGLHTQVGEWTKLWEEQTWVAHLPPAEFEELSELQRPTIQIAKKRSHKSVARLTKRTRALRRAIADAVVLVPDTAPAQVARELAQADAEKIQFAPKIEYSKDEYSDQIQLKRDLVVAKVDSPMQRPENILWLSPSVLEMKMESDRLEINQSAIRRSPAIPSQEPVPSLPAEDNKPPFEHHDRAVEPESLDEEVAVHSAAAPDRSFDRSMKGLGQTDFEAVRAFDASAMTDYSVSSQNEAAPQAAAVEPSTSIQQNSSDTSNVWISSSLVASLSPVLPKTTPARAEWKMNEPKAVKNKSPKTSSFESVALTEPLVEAAEVLVSKSALERQDAQAAATESEPLTEEMSEVEAPLFVEALQWRDAVFGAETETLSFESSERNFRAGKIRSWTKTTADGHLATLSLSQSPTLGRAIPLLSHNNLKALALMTNSGSATATLGVVFGRKTKGLDLDTDGRAEQVLVFSDPENEAFENFAILNVEPGARIVQASQPGSKKLFAGVAVPVLEGTATFVDLTQWRTRDIHGWVLDSDAREASGISQVEVRLLAQAVARAESDRWGRFKFEDISVVADHPVFLETDTLKTAGFTHRYQVYPEHLGGTALYRFGLKRVDQWVHQLEGGVSQNSGIVVAGLAPVAALTEKAGAAFPQLRLIAGSPEPGSEVYSANTKGELLVHQPHDKEGSQVVALQVSEGLHRFELVNQSQSLIWSQWVMSSPGVINVITMTPER